MPGRDDGWEVVVERAPGVKSSTYCSDWHRVERVCAALDQQERRTRPGAARIEIDPSGPSRGRTPGARRSSVDLPSDALCADHPSTFSI
jgi:hypothetical protein